MIPSRLAALLATTVFFLKGALTPSGIALSSSMSTSVFGQPVTFTASVTPSSASGKVTFYSGTSVLGIAILANGQATLSTILLPAGRQSVRAYYSGDATYRSGTSPAVAQQVIVTPASGFSPPGNYTAGNYPEAIAVGDFNGDGIADLAIAADAAISSPQGSAIVLLGNGDGTFQPPLTYNLTEPGNSELPGPFDAVVVGDFNGDGKADMVFDPNTVLLGNGDGTFQLKAPVQRAFVPFLASGDFNGDGKIDLVYPAGESLGVVLGNGDGTFMPESDYALTVPQYFSDTGNVVVADFNGDGKADVAVAAISYYSRTATINVFPGNGDGTFQPPISFSPASLTEYLAVGDFNGDGKADLAMANMDGPPTVFLGNGDGTFQQPLTVGPGAGFSAVVAGDFNGDGKPDLALSSGMGATVSVFWGNGDGTFQPARNYGAGNDPFALVSGEFKGDGRADLAVLSSGTTSGTDNLNILLGSAGITPAIALTSSLSSTTYGQNVTLTATLTPPQVGGTVTFEDGVTVLGTVSVQDGTAGLATSALTAGSHSLTAFYYSATENSASPLLMQTVARAATTTTLTSSANPSVFAQPLTLIATLNPSTATGAVSFISDPEGVLSSAAPVVNGVAVFSVSPGLQEDLGYGPIAAYYLGDSNYLASTSQALTQTVNPAPTSITLTSSPNPSDFNQNVTLTATVSPPTGGGVITFTDGVKTLGMSGAAGGSGTLVISTLSPGLHSLSASYAGYYYYTGSTSSVLSQTVSPPSSSAPAIQTGGVVNAADPLGSIGPGTWIAIYGRNLSTTTRTWSQADFAGNNLPASLDGVSATIDGKPAYIYYISPSQLNVLTPQDFRQGIIPVQVENSGSFSNSVTIENLQAGPALFAYSENPKYAIAQDGATYALIGPPGLLGSSGTTRPATVGELITLYATGLGETSPPYPDGQIVQAPAPVTSPPQIIIGGVTAKVEYAGLIEAGLYQINVTVPPVPSGDASVVLNYNNASLPAQVFISVQ